MKEGLLKIINHYGLMNQLKHFQSEVFELNEAIIGNEYDLEGVTDKGNSIDCIEEEFADCMVMLEQFKVYYNLDNDRIIEIMTNKVARQLKRMEEE